MAHTISIDVVDRTIPIGNNRIIPIINQPNPCYGYEANANEVRQLIQLSNYKITEAGTNKPITGNNYYEYFPEEQPGGGGGGGGGVTPAQVEAMIENSIDAVVSSTSKNAIQNKAIKKYVDDNVNSKVDKVSGKGLSTNDYTTAEKTKLEDIADIQSIGNGLSLDNGELSVTGGGGTLDYNDLENHPSINNITLVGNKSLSDLGIAAESDTYTKTEVDTALNGKVDKVSGKGLSTNDYTTAEKEKLADIEAQANKTVVDDTLSDSSTNPVQNKVVQAPFAKLVNAGQKNLLKITGTSQTIRGVTFTVNNDGTVSVDGTNNTSSSAVFYLNILPADTAPDYNGCRLTGCPQGGGTSTYRLSVQLNSGAFTVYASDIGAGSTIHDIPSADCRVAIVVYPGATVNNLIFKPMICTAEDYAISPKFVPSTKSNYELTQDVKHIPRLVDAGAKNLLNLVTPTTINRMTITDAGSGSVMASCSNTTWANSGYEFNNLMVGKTYKFIIYVDSASVSNVQFQCFVNDISGSTAQELGRTSRITSPGVYSIDFVATTKIRVGINLNNSSTAETGSATYHAMLCTVEDYAISPEFVPYRPSYDELIETTETNKNNISRNEAALVEIVDSGAKNLLKNTATSQTINGVTFTVNADKSVTVSGTATSNITSFFLSREAPALTGNMVLSGCPAGGSYETYRLDILDGTATGTVLCADYGEGTNVDWSLITTGKYTARIRIGAGTTVDGLIFKPMLCTVEEYIISPAFVPHVPTNKDLYEGKIDHDIPALTESILDYAVSLPAGLYFARHGAEVGTDKPETGKRYMYQIMKYSASTMTLIAYEGQSANSDSIYMKNYTSSNWGPWIKFTGTSVSYAMSNADLTAAIQDTQSQLDNQ